MCRGADGARPRQGLHRRRRRAGRPEPRQLARWLEEVRPAVARGLEDEAAATWRELTTGRKSDAQLVTGALEFVGGSAARPPGRSGARRSSTSSSSARPSTSSSRGRRGPQGQAGGELDPLRDEQRLADIEVGPCKASDDLGYRAEAGDSGLALRNGRVAGLDVVDLVPSEATLDLAAQAGVVAAHLGALEQEFDPATAWVVKDGAKKLNTPSAGSRGAGKTFAFERGGTDAAPLGSEARPVRAARGPLGRGRPQQRRHAPRGLRRGRPAREGATLSWREEDNAKRAEKLVRRLVERRALASLVDGSGGATSWRGSTRPGPWAWSWTRGSRSGRTA